ncbi:MAG: metal-dependent phosphohydrolase [Desulfobulbus propionicus]|nr:MAG: metal-dependent phosphohydrolase [Desulfobulbus propionicus]PIE60433.1 MAG: metal-dependent phosphohydrolase [Desulfobulbus propionicus]
MAADVTLAHDISAVILAAGFSSRMGKLKPLLPFGQATVLEHCIQLFQQCGIKDVVVVVGHRHAETIKVAQRAGARAVHNKKFEKGMYSSIRAGALALDKKSTGFFLLPVDIPLVRTGTIRLLLKAFQKKQPLVTYPLFAGKRGHPPFISAQLIPIITKTANPEGGMRSILQKIEDEASGSIHSVQVADANIHADMDTPDDYSRACQLLTCYEYPTMEECQVIMKKIHPLDERIRVHSQIVADTAVKLCEAIHMYGNQNPNIKLCRIGGLLHDIAKGEPEHDKTGSKWITALGFPPVAAIIAAHKDIPPSTNDTVTEEEIVYLADKLVKHDQLVSIEERFGNKLQLFTNTPDAFNAAQKRFTQAQNVAAKVEKVTGKPLPTLLYTKAC